MSTLLVSLLIVIGRGRVRTSDVSLHPSAQVNELSQKCWHCGKQVVQLRHFYFYTPPMWLGSLCKSQTAPKLRVQASQPGSTRNSPSSLTSPPAHPDEISNSLTLKYSISNNICLCALDWSLFPAATPMPPRLFISQQHFISTEWYKQPQSDRIKSLSPVTVEFTCMTLELLNSHPASHISAHLLQMKEGNTVSFRLFRFSSAIKQLKLTCIYMKEQLDTSVSL